MDLKVDPERVKRWGSTPGPITSIYVRAMADGEWGNHDIAVLDKASLLMWLRSRGGDNPFAEDVVGILLFHGQLGLHERGGA